MRIHSSILRTLLVAAAFSVTAACQSTGNTYERFDERSGTTWVVGDAPLVFARTEPRYSRSARDYVYLGPVEVNRRGTREQFLWVGVATTLDRGFLAPEISDPDRIVVMVGGEPVELLLEPWSRRVPALEAIAVYEPSVRPRLQLAARTTRDQLSMLLGEGVDSLRIGAADSGMREFFRWNRDAAGSEFLSGRSGP